MLLLRRNTTADVYRDSVAPSLYATLDQILLAPRPPRQSEKPHRRQSSGYGEVSRGRRRRRGSLTVFAYGQTGSGKTFTMEPIYAQTVAEALQACTGGTAVLSMVRLMAHILLSAY